MEVSTSSNIRNDYDLLTEEMILEFKEVFSVFDETGDGAIRIKDLKKVFKCLGQTPTHKEVDDMLTWVDSVK